eukprot:CAMPEP_0175078498 /NCGR_PEP_ID=MMETSP0052_2-20121109/24160_1 /TAXON_ID=51329 ORGANISM="Polytomella parva, Strain SAG 63-3" /NCGR_SAMPLE_ID=MMETSP0052_2 /ASSEMBLY_ACC=CAM_ASM_000194 /LENGTH=380 /DNA_ID=CAMNT_0016348443 /DNA_START=120 /DNA_END=1259 /DNA_ORIENTATION=+
MNSLSGRRDPFGDLCATEGFVKKTLGEMKAETTKPPTSSPAPVQHVLASTTSTKPNTSTYCSPSSSNVNLNFDFFSPAPKVAPSSPPPATASQPRSISSPSAIGSGIQSTPPDDGLLLFDFGGGMGGGHKTAASHSQSHSSSNVSTSNLSTSTAPVSSVVDPFLDFASSVPSIPAASIPVSSLPTSPSPQAPATSLYDEDPFLIGPGAAGVGAKEGERGGVEGGGKRGAVEGLDGGMEGLDDLLGGMGLRNPSHGVRHPSHDHLSGGHMDTDSEMTKGQGQTRAHSVITHQDLLLGSTGDLLGGGLGPGLGLGLGLGDGQANDKGMNGSATTSSKTAPSTSSGKGGAESGLVERDLNGRGGFRVITSNDPHPSSSSSSSS